MSQLLANANICFLFTHADKKLCSRSAVGALNDNNDGLITESFDKASILQQTFASSFIADNGILPEMTSRLQSGNSLSHFYFAPS
jgi:hypothetical protein